MRVLFVTNMWPDEERPWYGTFIKTQAESLERLGVDLDVLAIRGYAGRSAYAHAPRELRRRLRAGGYDLVHAHYGHAGVVGRLQANTPLVVSYCGDDLIGTPAANGRVTPRSRLEATVFRQLARVATATITKSAAMEELLPQSARKRNHVIPNGVDIERFDPLPRDEARARLGWPVEERVVLFAGDPAIPRKNHPLAEAACRAASARVPSVALRVASGYAPSEMPVLMSAADALLLTSLSEGSPNVVKEAMASALPVVSTPAGDAPERLEGVPGCAVRPYDAAALADGIAQALNHGRCYEARAAVSELSLENVARRVLGVYAEALGGDASVPSRDGYPETADPVLANRTTRD